MIDVLKKKLKINTVANLISDCEFIANYILEQYDTNISYNTLRRFFGLKRQTKHKNS